MTSARMSGFSPALDWRPLLFQEPAVAQMACSLCGVLSRRAYRLPCAHTLCSECHEESARGGSTCPLDDASFGGDAVLRLDVQDGYAGELKVACWNASSGCNFVGPTANLLEHFQQCAFHVVSCPKCHSSVLRSCIVGHCKDGCSSVSPAEPVAPAEPITAAEPVTLPQPATDLNVTVYGVVENASKKLSKEVGRLYEEFCCLHTSLNQCREDIRISARDSRDQLEARLAFLSEQLVGLSALSAESSAATVDIGNALKTHVSSELRMQCERLTSIAGSTSPEVSTTDGGMEVYWRVVDWAALKAKAERDGTVSVESPVQNAFGYRVSHSVSFRKSSLGLHCWMALRIHPGDDDLVLEWPFRKAFAMGVINPADKAKRLFCRNKTCCGIEKPVIRHSTSGGCVLSKAKDMETAGVVKDDALYLFFQIES
ncbi:unnamed protein product [Ixodes pacificus]